MVRLSGVHVPGEAKMHKGGRWQATFFELTFSFSSGLLSASSNQKYLNTKIVLSENPIEFTAEANCGVTA